MQQNQTGTAFTKRRKRRSRKPLKEVGAAVPSHSKSRVSKKVLMEKEKRVKTRQSINEKETLQQQIFSQRMVSNSLQEDTGILLISKKAPTVKYANFEEYMKNH